LFIAAGLGALQAASGCGRADSPRLDSETHWLTTCQSDRDCEVGSCECGVCTQNCASSADCSVLGLTGVECVPQPALCGASGEGSPGASSACFLPCEDKADCGALGSGAFCQAQRCERLAGFLADGSTGAALLCDGSEDVRFFQVDTGSDGIANYYNRIAEVRGGGFLAIDGQCRFWTASGATNPVTSGTLSAEDAAAFASSIGYERFAEYAPYDDQEGCIGVGLTRIWSPASRAHCICACSEDPELQGWGQAISWVRAPAVRELFANGQPLTSPLRLALMRYDRLLERDPMPWPLSRAPADNETYPVDFDQLLLDESSGVEITDPGELSALRAARDSYMERQATLGDFTPLVWTDPDTQQPVWFHMLLRDELPPNVQAALERPLF
jgi:hypothetical protein